MFDERGYVYHWRDMPGETGPAARILVADLVDGREVYFGNTIDPAVEEALRSIPVARLSRETIMRDLDRQRPCEPKVRSMPRLLMGLRGETKQRFGGRVAFSRPPRRSSEREGCGGRTQGSSTHTRSGRACSMPAA